MDIFLLCTDRHTFSMAIPIICVPEKLFVSSSFSGFYLRIVCDNQIQIILTPKGKKNLFELANVRIVGHSSWYF